MIPLSEYPLQDFRHKDKLPTIRERDLEFRVKMLEDKVAELIAWKNRHE